ncbi:hypothetical protein AG1IA_09942 [Rhizoctonia solani AG-1 IA]|uniref:Uncharacterized protein n=1 Tax=Thanatephorus cucumeris (strain AG1-IA) TaxID=983506 RepID=L8WGX0_THACA|nr:hypothetical protein AG1IA_09942 [Rhizoctonia solani AG-1 IA]
MSHSGTSGSENSSNSREFHVFEVSRLASVFCFGKLTWTGAENESQVRECGCCNLLKEHEQACYICVAGVAKTAWKAHGNRERMETAVDFDFSVRLLREGHYDRLVSRILAVPELEGLNWAITRHR